MGMQILKWKCVRGEFKIFIVLEDGGGGGCPMRDYGDKGDSQQTFYNK